MNSQTKTCIITYPGLLNQTDLSTYTCNSHWNVHSHLQIFRSHPQWNDVPWTAINVKSKCFRVEKTNETLNECSMHFKLQRLRSSSLFSVLFIIHMFLLQKSAMPRYECTASHFTNLAHSITTSIIVHFFTRHPFLHLTPIQEPLAVQ